MWFIPQMATRQTNIHIFWPIMGPSKGVQVELTCEHLYFFNQFLKHKYIKIKACSYKVGFLKAQTIMQFLIFFIQITMYRHACLYKLEFI